MTATLPTTAQQLLDAADQVMYAQKTARRRTA
jgi:hypothetical protein